MKVLCYEDLSQELLTFYGQYPDSIAALAEWVTKPDMELFPMIYTACNLFKSKSTANEFYVYRGMLKVKTNQDHMTITPYSKVGDVLSYENKANPLSFTTDISVATQYGDMIVASLLDTGTYDILELTDELMYLISLKNKVLEPFTEKEIILVPAYNIIYRILKI